MDVAHPLLLFPLPFWVRSGLSWHYPNSPKNRKTALSPRHDRLQRGSTLKKDPLRIWFYPQ
ncbi:serine/threonine protein kinase [Salmonella enterica subsp. salamae serovar 13,22:z:-]|uniref:serine/threonine protein kinase n=1 Tax=Salmonella enterica TaxID=28901 RepID=UPI00103519CB|nr:serine/threonine protein kinase [Salmonella enterica]TBN97406.1 serine/threonine protein kinase [Salmonella enterica subsp. salamae serovar 13,22:z:-]